MPCRSCSCTAARGIYTGLISTSPRAALTLGYRQALFVAPLTALIAIPLVLILTALVRSLHHYRPRGVFETLWQSAAMTLALLPSGWLYGQFGTQPLGWPIDGSAYLAALSFVVLYFSFVAALETGWLYGDIDPRRYWGAYGKSFVMNGLIAALLLARPWRSAPARRSSIRCRRSSHTPCSPCGWASLRARSSGCPTGWPTCGC